MSPTRADHGGDAAPATMTDAAPVELIDHRSSGVLEVLWPDATRSRLSHALLRDHCRCAACEQQRRHGQRAAPADAALRLTRLEPVGRLGLRMAFSDGHDRGIYPWAYLRQLGEL